MKIIDYFLAEDRECWFSRIKESDWDAAQFLCELLETNSLKRLVGEKTKLLLLIDGEELISFCTFAERDDIPNTELTPWIGWVYTFPKYRGNRYAGKLLDHARELAFEQGHANIYISTNAVGLYEKYGYTFYKIMQDLGGEDSRVYTTQTKKPTA